MFVSKYKAFISMAGPKVSFYISPRMQHILFLRPCVCLKYIKTPKNSS